MSQHSVSVLAAVATGVCWAAFLVTWAVGAYYNAQRGPADRERRAQVSGLAVGWFAAFACFKAVPAADLRVVQVLAPGFRIPGLVILIAATAFTLWARIGLGTMWSSTPTVKEGHTLRTTGPYGVTRHPIYTGILGMTLGTALLGGAGPWALPFLICLPLCIFKIRTEEGLMSKEFPEEYARYRRQVPQLVPGLRLLARHGAAAG